MEVKFEEMKHGRPGYRIGTYSETRFGAEYRYHDDYEILYVAKGELRIGIDEASYPAPEGSVFFFDKNRPHCVDVSEAQKNGDFHWYAILFDASFLGGEADVCRDFLEKNVFNTFLSPDDILHDLIVEINRVDWACVNGYEFRVKALLMNLVGYIIETKQYRPRDMTRPFENAGAAVNTAIDYMEANYSEKISLTDIAQSTGYSEKHLSRVFKKCTGMSVIQYLISHRIKAACRELLYSDKSVTRIAMECGFTNISYFNRAFLKQTDMTPTDYRDLTEKMYEYAASIDAPRKNTLV